MQGGRRRNLPQYIHKASVPKIGRPGFAAGQILKKKGRGWFYGAGLLACVFWGRVILWGLGGLDFYRTRSCLPSVC